MQAANFSPALRRWPTCWRSTLGPTGGPVMSYDATRHKVEVLDDAATTLRRILGLGRPDLDVGAMLLRGVVWRLEQQVGDGGATAVVLLRALVEEGMRQVTAGANAMRLIEGMRRGAPSPSMPCARRAARSPGSAAWLPSPAP